MSSKGDSPKRINKKFKNHKTVDNNPELKIKHKKKLNFVIKVEKQSEIESVIRSFHISFNGERHQSIPTKQLKLLKNIMKLKI